MPWRLHLTNRALQRLDILSEKLPAVLAAWTQPGRVSYVDMASGTLLTEKRLTDLGNRQPERWLLLQPELPAPNSQYPPVIPGPNLTIHLSQTGQQRLYHLSSGEVYFATGAQETRLDADSGFAACALMPANERMAALDRKGRLHIYQQSTLIGTFETGFSNLDPDVFTVMTASHHAFYVVHQNTIIIVDADGHLRRRLDLHYPIGAFASSPGGRWLACCDHDTNVIRMYQASDLIPLYQRHALDLMAKALQVQLIADPPPARAALRILAADDEGMLAFALAGVVCVTDITQMSALPRPAPPVQLEPL